ncbi:MAG: response regulator [Flavobacteriaceae bacterium]|nr:response regulator [Flavobacteriaceae bacterium]
MHSRKKILLIEDDVMLGGTLKEFLVLSNFYVKWVKSAKDGFSYLVKNKVDVVISDLMMPSISGEQLFLMIRKDKKFSSIPFIMITANASEEVKFRQLELGVNDFISKPFKIKELGLRITNIIDFRSKVIKQVSPDPFSRITITLSDKPFLDKIDEILAQSLKLNLTLEEIAFKLNVSKSTLDKKMRKLSNVNTSQYIREFKLNYAISLIKLGERNIQFIAFESGFNSFSYFSTSFKSYTQMSPRDYIKFIEQNIK